MFKAISVEKKDNESLYSAVLTCNKSKEKKLEQKVGKVTLKIYKKQNDTTIMLTNVKGAPAETSEETADFIQRLIEDFIEGKELPQILKELEEEEKVEEALEKLRKHESISKIICKTCNRTFKSENNLRVHEYKMHRETCDICKAKFKEKSGLEKHMMRIHKIKEKCNLCKKEFIDTEDLKVHIKKVHETKPNLPCKSCDRTFNSYDELKTHMKAHELELVKKERNEIKTDPDTFDKKEEVAKTGEESSALKCNKCLYMTSSKQNLADHKNENHCESEDDLSKIICKECPAVQGKRKQFHDNTELKNHKEMIHGTIRCIQCQFTTSDIESLDIHI